MYRNIIICCVIFISSTSSQDNYISKDLDVDIFEQRQYFQGDGFDSDNALRYLFPGNMYDIESYPGLELTSVWTCRTCHKRNYNFAIIKDNSPYFPLDINYTTVLGVKDYYDKDNKYKYLFFNTKEDAIGAGRFLGAYVGMAIFQLQNGIWNLTYFDAGIDCIGNWGKAPEPKEIFKLGDNKVGLFFSVLHEGMAMEDYDPYYGYLLMYANINTNYSRVFFLDYSSCKNWDTGLGSEWQSRISILENDKFKGLYKIQVITEGIFDPKNYEKDMLPDQKLIELTSRNKTTGFTLTRTFAFNGSEYDLESSYLDYLK